MIEIHWDYTTGKEISLGEGLVQRSGFETHCLEFFNTKYIPFQDGVNDIIVRKKNRDYISLKEIFENDGRYTSKEIRRAHNILKILLADGFKWQKKKETNDD